MQSCLSVEKKYSVINSTLNQMLTDNGKEHTLMHYLKVTKKDTIHNKIDGQINELIPAL